MQLSNGEVFTLVLTAVGVIIWLVRLEGRVNLNERLLSERIEKVKEDVGYIRERIDEIAPPRRRRSEDETDAERHERRRDPRRP